MEWQPGREHAPQAFIDAGDLPWQRLEPILVRTLSMLAAGEVMELRSGDPDAIGAIHAWCEEHGCVPIHREPGDGAITFWIGMREEDLQLVEGRRVQSNGPS